MSIEWFRLYHGTVTDPKLALVAKRSKQSRGNVVAVWVALLETASQANPRGDVSKFDADSIAVALDLDEEAIPDILAAMTDKGMISDGKLTSWEKRQVRREREDDSRERVAEYRKRKGSVTPSNANSSVSNAKKSSVTPGNATVTPVTLIDTDTDTDSDSDSDSDSEAKRESKEKDPPNPQSPSKPKPKKSDPFDPTTMPIPDWLPSESWQDWCQHRINIKNPMTELSANGVIRKLKQALDAGMSPVDLIVDAVAVGRHPMPVYDNQIESFNQLRHKPGKPTQPPGIEPPPYEKIVTDYNAGCPDMIQAEVLNEKRKAMIDENWYRPIMRTDGTPILGSDLGKWKKLWPWLHENCPFLSGDNDRGWRANLEWILNQDNMLKIYEGKFTRKTNV